MKMHEPPKNLPSVEELEAVRKYTAKTDEWLVSNNIFRAQVMNSLQKFVKPPGKKHLGKRRREVKLQPISPAVWRELTSTLRLPEKDTKARIERREDGELKPTRSGPTQDVYSLKLQEAKHIRDFLQLHKVKPMRAFAATKIHLSTKREKAGEKSRVASMAAAPLTLRCTMPKGKGKRMRLPMFSAKSNVITMDNQAEITFGVTEYPPWLKKNLRHFLYTDVEKMATMGYPISDEILPLIERKLADPMLCRRPK